MKMFLTIFIAKILLLTNQNFFTPLSISSNSKIHQQDNHPLDLQTLLTFVSD